MPLLITHKQVFGSGWDMTVAVKAMLDGAMTVMTEREALQTTARWVID